MENGRERFLPSRYLDTAAEYYLASSLCHLIVIDIIEEMKVLQPVVC